MGKKISADFALHANIYEELSLIENQLQNPITPHQCSSLFYRLEKTLEIVKTVQKQIHISIESSAILQKLHLEEIEEKIRTLFGKTIERKVDYQLELIEKKTQGLDAILKTPHKIGLQSHSTFLQNDVEQLLHDHCLSKEQLIIIQRAKKTLKLAEQHQKIQPNEIKRIAHSHLYFYDEDMLIDIINELFDLAVCFLKNEKARCRAIYGALNSSTTKTIEKHTAILNAELFTDRIASAQASIAAAYELIGVNDLYFSHEEILSFYNDIIYLEKDEEELLRKKIKLSG